MLFQVGGARLEGRAFQSSVKFIGCFARSIAACTLERRKTHSLTNEQFNAIVSEPCFYCGKARPSDDASAACLCDRQEPRKPKTRGPDDRGHFNGLDRLDSEIRVYAKETTAAGTMEMRSMGHTR